MKYGYLTEKQQAKERAKIFKTLVAMGFTFDEAGNYYWIEIRNKRLGVGFNVKDCLGGKIDWIWQTSEEGVNPAFGYSGSTSVGGCYGTFKRIMQITLENIYYMGFFSGMSRANAVFKNDREEIRKAISDLHNVIGD